MILFDVNRNIFICQVVGIKNVDDVKDEKKNFCKRINKNRYWISTKNSFTRYDNWTTPKLSMYLYIIQQRAAQFFFFYFLVNVVTVWTEHGMKVCLLLKNGSSQKADEKIVYLTNVSVHEMKTCSIYKH